MSGDVRQLREQVRQAEAQRSELLTQRATVQQQLDQMNTRTAPAPFGYDQVAARQYRQQLLGLDAFLADIDDRLAALHAQLPTADQIADGRQQAAQLVTAWRTADATFGDAADRYFAALDDADRASRQLQEARSASRAAAHRLAAVVAAHGLTDVPVPDLAAVAQLSTVRQKIAFYRGLWIRDSAIDTPDPLLERELVAALDEAAQA